MANRFDADQAPEGSPTEIIIGDFVQWKRSDLTTDYPTDSYSAKYVARITAGGSAEFQITSTVSGGAYLFSASSSTTSGYTAGSYHWQLEILQTSDSARAIVDRGTFEIIVDLDNDNADPRAHAEIMLAKIESLLEGRADGDVSNYSIQGRSLTKIGIEELLSWRDYYKAEVVQIKRRERIRLGRSTDSGVKVRFI